MTPELRVQAFIEEFDAHWRTVVPAFEDPFGDEMAEARANWPKLMEQTERTHFVEEPKVPLTRLHSGFSGPKPRYGVQVERVVDTVVRGDKARVQVESTFMGTNTHEYTLQQVGDDWRIASISYNVNLGREPFVNDTIIKRNVKECSAEAEFNEMPEAQAALDENHNFTERDVERAKDGETSRVVITPVGTLVTATGVLTAWDFGSDNDEARPLARTVEPGSYPVDRVSAFERNAAVRVKFSDAVPTQWHPASLPGSGHVLSVDAGCVCIVDYAAYAGMTERAKEVVFDKFNEAERPASGEFKVGRKNVGVAVDSGYGDGGYPAYWGVDEQGKVSQLVIDFLVLTAQDDDGVLTHL